MSRWLKEYCYTKDYKFYHNNGKTFTPITRKEYKEKTGESDYIIEKLRNSIWPYQSNDYFFNKGTRSSLYKYIPTDWKLNNLYKYLNKNGFHAAGSDQGNGCKLVHFHIDNSKNLIPFLIDKLGENNIIEISTTVDFNKVEFANNNWYDPKIHDKKIIVVTQKSIYKNNKKETTKSIRFSMFILRWLHNKLNLEYPDLFYFF